MIEDITIGQLVVALTFIVSAFTVVSKVITPIQNYNKRLDDVEEHIDNDNRRLKTLEDDSRMTLKVLNSILGHLQTGNQTKEMAQVKKELENYIISK